MKIWQIGIELVMDVYNLTKQFPEFEKFGLISQINRCAVSIPSNIAEGSGRGTDKDFRNFLSNALGSLYELETQIIISHKLTYINIETYQSIETKISELERMIIGLIKSLTSKI